jgi:hypothetical protein
MHKLVWASLIRPYRQTQQKDWLNAHGPALQVRVLFGLTDDPTGLAVAPILFVMTRSMSDLCGRPFLFPTHVEHWMDDRAVSVVALFTPATRSDWQAA